MATVIYQPFVYKWTELTTNKWYIGARYAKLCHPDDGYITSSRIVKPLIQQHPSNWRREILYIGQTREEVLEYESNILKELDAKHDLMSYNQHNGDGKFYFKWHTEEAKEKMRFSRDNGHTGLTRTEQVKQNMSKAQKKRYANKPMSQETKEKLRIGNSRPKIQTKPKVMTEAGRQAIIESNKRRAKK